jgi:hypothetical protein
MYQSRRETGEEDLWGIDIDAVHGSLSGGSEYNVNWNMRTLILMARAVSYRSRSRTIPGILAKIRRQMLPRC